MKIRTLLLALCAASFASLSPAQIQTAGNLYVNVDATGVATGLLNTITNAGSLGNNFAATGGGTTIPLGTNVAGVNAILFDGSNDYLILTNLAGTGLIAPPLGLVGVNSTASIEVWVYNPAVATEETMVSWGKRGTAGANRAFEYGYSGQLGAACHTGSGAPDLGWDDNGGAPLNNRWHHLVYTYDGTTTRVYSDGALVNAETQSINVATNAGLMLGAQWNAAGTAVGSQFGSLAIARVRIHDGALTPAQIVNNYNFEKATFQAAAPTPTLLSSGPTHRYSFNEAATNDATGLAFNDSIGTAHGTVQGSPGLALVAGFSGSRLVLPGGIIATGPYGDLPNGLLSANSTNNSGTGEVSIEVWFKVTNTRTWSHVFDFGSCGILGSPGVELTGPGGQAGQTALDDLMYGAQVNTDMNRHRLEWGNRDPNPSGSTTNPITTAEVTQFGVFNTDRHVVVTWKESTGQIFTYENGTQVAAITISNSISAINDINNWLGRTQYGTDNTMQGEFDEVRIYNHVLTAGEALGNFQAGPDIVNTSATLAIAAQPQNASVLQGNTATFSISAGGTPPLFYQWRRNGTPISGATDRVYQTPATTTANNGDLYSCLVSNLTTSVTSSTGTLTVIPNQSPSLQVLHETRDGNRDNFPGVVGGLFQVGSSDVPVTHLGFYDIGLDGLVFSHRVGIWPASGGTNPIAFVTVPAGTGALLVNGYRYVALDSPLLLSNNTSYIIAAESYNGGGDGWPDNFAPLSWNSAIVGTNGFDTRVSRWTSSLWPNAPGNANLLNGIYGAPNLATIPVGPPAVGAVQTNVTQYAGLSVTLRVVANGEGPLGLQWYKAPSTLLPGQTNASLTFASAAVPNSGDYYVIATNALSSAQSSNITLTVLADTPVNITQQPTNTTVPEGFPVTFYIGAAGTPPIYYQWRLGGSPIANATNSSYAIPAVGATNNAQVYSCVVSNFANSSPQTQTSANATLTVQPNRAVPTQVLHDTVSGNRDNFAGVVGGVFQVGDTDALVTHVGYFDLDNDGLSFSHRVGVFTASGALIASSTVPAGTGAYLTNGYRWVALDAPILLTNNISYVIGAEVFASSGDGWADQFTPPNWNAYYVGSQPTTTRQSRFGGGAWPTFPSGASSLNAIYGAPMIGVLPIGAPVVAVQQTNATRYVGDSVTFTALANGQTPLTLQWYKAPSTLLSGQTNTTLTLSSLTTGDSGNYYLVGTNPQSSAQSSNVTLTVYANTAPIITQQPQPQSVYLHQRAFFSVSAIGQQPLSYQWKYLGSPIVGATNSNFTLTDATLAKAGNYTVTITNALGATNSAAAALNILSPAAESYPVAVLNASPLVYYRFSDATNGASIAFNLGSLGATHNGTYEGTFSSDAGPQPPTFPNFETNNLAFKDDTLTADVAVPDVTLDTNSGAHATFIAWINRNGSQADNAGIVFSRANNAASGIGVKQSGGDMLMYHWNNLYFGFTSGLMIPDSQWTFVACVVEPTQATLYMNDGSGMVTATNVAVHAAVPVLGATYVGLDAASGVRRLYGMIDEPMIFDRSLSPTEINSLYYAALLPVVELNIGRSGNNVILTWPSGTLQHADEAAGPYLDLPTATSPYTNSVSSSKQFYRVKVQ